MNKILLKFHRARNSVGWQQCKSVYWALILYTLTVGGVAVGAALVLT